MSANIVELCEGVASALNSAPVGTFDEDFTAVFEYAPVYSNMDAKTLRVIVTDSGGDIELMARARLGFTDNVRIVILWRVDAGATGIDTDKMKDALLLLEQITKYLMGRSIGNYRQTGTIRRGDGEKEKQHYMPGNLEDRSFAAAIIASYVTTESIRDAEGS